MTDTPGSEASSLVSDPKMGHIQGRKRFDDISRKLGIVFTGMTVNDKIAVDNFTRIVRNSVPFAFPPIEDHGDLFDYDFESVKFSTLPEYRTSGTNIWTISFEIEFNTAEVSETVVSTDDGFPYNLPFYL